jgi:predicted amidophosphoribosyltransferase
MNKQSMLGLSAEAGAEHSGSELNRFSLTRPRRCRQCGKDVSRSIKRCPNCGQPLSARPHAN